MNKEPAVIVTSIVAALAEIVGLGVAFGLDISEEQRNAVIATATALAGTIALVGPVIRQFVVPNDKAAALVSRAARIDPNSPSADAQLNRMLADEGLPRG